MKMNDEEPSIVKRMRKKLSRDYGCRVYERDFNLAVRLPLKSIESIDKEDLLLTRESLEILGIEIIEEKTVSAYLIADRDHIEMEIDLFLKCIEEEEAEPIVDQLSREESQVRSSIDERVRKMLENMARAQRTKNVEGVSTSSGSKIKASYTLGGRGRVVGSRPARKDANFSDIAIIPTIRHAIREGSFDRIRGLRIKQHHLQEKIYRSRTQTNVCIVVDTSFYPDMQEEINTMLWVIRVIFTMAYEKRHHVGIVSFSGNSANMELPFTTDVDKGYEVVENLEYGGLSPFASGLKMGIEMLEKQRGDRAETVSLMVVLTRGKANVPLYPGGFLRRELIYLAKLLGESSINAVMVHIGEEEEHLMKELSLRSGSKYYRPPLLEKRIASAMGFLETVERRGRDEVISSSKRFLKSLDD